MIINSANKKIMVDKLTKEIASLHDDLYHEDSSSFRNEYTVEKLLKKLDLAYESLEIISGLETKE